MSPQRTYPAGVPCWVDTDQPDPDAACRFYGELFGWTFEDAVPAQAPGSYLIAALDGEDVAAIAPGATQPGAWNTYVAVDDADTAAVTVVAAGGTVVSEPADAGEGGRAATCTDPAGAAFGLWQPRRRLGAQAVNVAGTWNFSHLRTGRPDQAREFYGNVFGWETMDAGGGAVYVAPARVRRPPGGNGRPGHPWAPGPRAGGIRGRGRRVGVADRRRARLIGMSSSRSPIAMTR